MMLNVQVTRACLERTSVHPWVPYTDSELKNEKNASKSCRTFLRTEVTCVTIFNSEVDGCRVCRH